MNCQFGRYHSHPLHVCGEQSSEFVTCGIHTVISRGGSADTVNSGVLCTTNLYYGYYEYYHGCFAHRSGAFAASVLRDVRQNNTRNIPAGVRTTRCLRASVFTSQADTRHVCVRSYVLEGSSVTGCPPNIPLLASIYIYQRILYPPAVMLTRNGVQ